MQAIIDWLTRTESEAAELYHAAADYFASDPVFSGFLKKLAEEEEWHRQLVASLQIGDGDLFEDESLVLLDQSTLENTHRLFSDARQRLVRGEMDRQQMFETIAAAEFSEWNDLFLYALYTLKGRSTRFLAAVEEIERHKDDIVAFFSEDAEAKPFVESLLTLPSSAERRILIIEQNQSLAIFLRSILAPIGEVELAENGTEGLSKMEKGSFDVIISDTDMPAMEIYEFYQRAVAMLPEMKDRFLFFSGSAPEAAELEPLSASNWLNKPALVSQIRQAVCDITNRDRTLH